MQQYFPPSGSGYDYSHAWRHALPPGPTCGLYTDFYGHRRFISLVSLEAHTTIVSSTSRTVLTQTFQSPKIVSAQYLENVTYIFPLYDGVSVVAFTCTVGSRVIKGVVKERSEAKKAFDAAVLQGKTAGLLEQSLEASDVFTTSLGNIPIAEPVTVEVTYLGELKHDAQVDGLRFTIPTSVAPRYGHHALQGWHTSLGEKHISITVDVDVSGSSTIKSVQSPSHPISVNIGTLSTATAEPPSLQRAYATLSQGSTELDKDFVIQVVANGLGDPIAVLEEHPTIPNQRALMATLVPRFSLPPSMSEVVFMCDRSGSMGSGGKIPNVIAALKVFLKSLPIGVKFNICSFGSHHSFLWERSQTYDENSLRTAISHVSSFDASLGGTEMYNPMADIFFRRYSDMNLEVFLLTDGETWDQQTLFQLVNSNVSQSQGAIRIFTLGVGAMASHALIQGVARAGNGFAQVVADGERVDKMLIRMLKGALTPHVTDYTLEIKYSSDEMSEEESGDDFEVIEKIMDAMTLELPLSELSDVNASGSYKIEISLFDESVEDKDLEMSGTSDVRMNPPAVAVPRYLQAPFQIPPLFPFSRTTVYVLLSDSTPNRQPKSVILRGTSPQGPLSLEIPITILANKGTTIHQLAARKAMRELEDGRGWIFHAKDEQEQFLQNRYEGQFSDMVKREAVRLGTQYQVSGKWCSFVAIEDDEIKAVESEEIEIIDDDDLSVTRIGTGTGFSDTRSADTRSGGEDVRRRNTAASARFRRAKKSKRHMDSLLDQIEAANTGLPAQDEIQDQKRMKILESAPKVSPAEAAQPPMAQPQMMGQSSMDRSQEASFKQQQLAAQQARAQQLQQQQRQQQQQVMSQHQPRLARGMPPSGTYESTSPKDLAQVHAQLQAKERAEAHKLPGLELAAQARDQEAQARAHQVIMQVRQQARSSIGAASPAFAGKGSPGQSNILQQQSQMQSAQQQQQHILGMFPGDQATNHANQDYQMRLMLLEQQNKKRLMMARQEQQQDATSSSSKPHELFGNSSLVTPPVVGNSGSMFTGAPPGGVSLEQGEGTAFAGGPIHPFALDFASGYSGWAKPDDVLQGFDFDSFLGQPEDTEEDLIDYSDEEAQQAAPEDTPMSTLFFEQTFIGYWDWSPSLEAIVGVTRLAALADIQLPGQYDQLEVVLATLCAVAYLKKKQAREKDVWELIVEKAEDWLRGQTQEDVMELEKIVEGALFADDAA